MDVRYFQWWMIFPENKSHSPTISSIYSSRKKKEQQTSIYTQV